MSFTSNESILPSTFNTAVTEDLAKQVSEGYQLGSAPQNPKIRALVEGLDSSRIMSDAGYLALSNLRSYSKDRINKIIDFFVQNEGRFGKIVSLDLESSGLTEFPESILTLRDLVNLHLYDNRLPSIPESVNKLSKLHNLDLQRNSITCIPSSIGDLKKLEVLNLCGNKLSDLPESINGLTNLKVFDLYSNRINIMPQISGLTKLKELNLRNNNFTTLPVEDFVNLTNLEFLDVRENTLDQVSQARLEELKNIKRIFFNSEQVTNSISSRLSQLMKRIFLDIK